MINNLSGDEPFNGWTGFNAPGDIEQHSGLWVTKAGTRYFKKGFEYDPNKEAHHYEWVAVVEGTLTIEHSNKKTIVPKGMYYFMDDKVKMKCRVSDNYPLLVWFEFTGPLCESISSIMRDSLEHITTGRYSYGQLKTVLQMAYVLQFHPPRFNLTIQSLLWRFIAETSGSIPYESRNYSPEIMHAIDYLKSAPLNAKPSIDDLAKASTLSIETFRKRFRAETGEAPLQYMLRYKIAKAKELIGNKELTIKQIAYETGFKDPYYFSRLFKRYENVSPMSFRKKIYRDDMND